MTLLSFNGRVALVTGASRGIGAAVAVELAKSGAHIVLTARTIGGLEQTDDAIRQIGGKATLIPLDLLKADDIDKLGPAIFEHFGRLDMFVGNAGMLSTLGPVATSDPKEWTKVMDTNVNANFRLIRTLHPLLNASPAGRAVFVSTGEQVVKGRAYWGSYSVSKAALESLAQVYAAETVNTKLRVNIIDPGAVRTKMRASAKPGEDPMTLPTPENIAPKFLELLSESCTRHGEVIRL